jgi:SecA DEAD-like domain
MSRTGKIANILSQAISGFDAVRAVTRIRERTSDLAALSDAEVRVANRRLIDSPKLPPTPEDKDVAFRLSGKKLDELDIEALGLAREAFMRFPPEGITVGTPPYDQQVLLAAHLMRGSLVQMDTGEGKTFGILIAALALLRRHRNVYIISANPYLAARDARSGAPLWTALGVSVGIALPQEYIASGWMSWDAKVVYTTANHLIFSQLSDDIRKDPRGRLVSAQAAILIDEVDAIILDQTQSLFRTTRTVSGAAKDWNLAIKLAKLLKPHHFTKRPFSSELRAYLTLEGQREIGRLSGSLMDEARHLTLYQDIELAYTGLFEAQENRDYLVVEQFVIAVDPVSGWKTFSNTPDWIAPLAYERRLRGGFSNQTLHFTYGMDVFMRFPHLAGASGTVVDEAIEYIMLLNLPAVAIPPRVPRQRGMQRDLNFGSFEAIQRYATNLMQTQASRRPMLIVTSTNAEAYHLSDSLRSSAPAGVSVRLAWQDSDTDQQAFEEAGRAGVVIVSTKQAGRGVDIQLDEEARKNGGSILLLIGHSVAVRHDRQLLGRVGRSGDPYLACFCNYPGDELLRHIPAARFLNISRSDHPLRSRNVERAIRSAQKRFRYVLLSEFARRTSESLVASETYDILRDWRHLAQEHTASGTLKKLFLENVAEFYLSIHLPSLKSSTIVSSELAGTAATKITRICHCPHIETSLSLKMIGQDGHKAHQILKTTMIEYLEQSVGQNESFRDSWTHPGLEESASAVLSLVRLAALRRRLNRLRQVSIERIGETPYLVTDWRPAPQQGQWGRFVSQDDSIELRLLIKQADHERRLRLTGIGTGTDITDGGDTGPGAIVELPSADGSVGSISAAVTGSATVIGGVDASSDLAAVKEGELSPADRRTSETTDVTHEASPVVIIGEPVTDADGTDAVSPPEAVDASGPAERRPPTPERVSAVSEPDFEVTSPSDLLNTLTTRLVSFRPGLDIAGKKEMEETARLIVRLEAHFASIASDFPEGMDKHKNILSRNPPAIVGETLSSVADFMMYSIDRLYSDLAQRHLQGFSYTSAFRDGMHDLSNSSQAAISERMIENLILGAEPLNLDSLFAAYETSVYDFRVSIPVELGGTGAPFAENEDPALPETRDELIKYFVAASETGPDKGRRLKPEELIPALDALLGDLPLAALSDPEGVAAALERWRVHPVRRRLYPWRRRRVDTVVRQFLVFLHDRGLAARAPSGVVQQSSIMYKRARSVLSGPRIQLSLVLFVAMVTMTLVLGRLKFTASPDFAGSRHIADQALTLGVWENGSLLGPAILATFGGAVIGWLLSGFSTDVGVYPIPRIGSVALLVYGSACLTIVSQDPEAHTGRSIGLFLLAVVVGLLFRNFVWTFQNTSRVQLVAAVVGVSLVLTLRSDVFGEVETFRLSVVAGAGFVLAIGRRWLAPGLPVTSMRPSKVSGPEYLDGNLKLPAQARWEEHFYALFIAIIIAELVQKIYDGHASRFTIAILYPALYLIWLYKISKSVSAVEYWSRALREANQAYRSVASHPDLISGLRRLRRQFVRREAVVFLTMVGIAIALVPSGRGGGLPSGPDGIYIAFIGFVAGEFLSSAVGTVHRLFSLEPDVAQSGGTDVLSSDVFADSQQLLRKFGQRISIVVGVVAVLKWFSDVAGIWQVIGNIYAFLQSLV